MNGFSANRPKRVWLALAAFLVVPILSGTVGAGTREEAISVVDVDKLQWKDYPGLPGVTFTVVAGDPSQPGIYTIRAKFAPHTMSQPHWHPETRYVTVIKGTWWTGAGPKFDPEITVPVRVGGFAIHTPKEIHYDGAKDEEVIVQISGIGPSGTTPVNPDGTDKK
jgi:hypothetical protein